MDAKNLPKWQEIQQDFADTLVIGNGCSMALCKSFNYKDLYEYGCKNEFVNDSVKQIFKHLSSEHKDFERVLYRLWQLKKVNNILDIQDPDNLVDASISIVKKALLLTVRGVHPRYAELNYTQLRNVGRFANRFSTVFSLNYDLTLHWALSTAAKEGAGKHTDGFTSLSKRPSKQKIKQYRFDEKRFNDTEIHTHVLYPHGNLALYKNTKNTESRLVGESDGLLNELTSYWNKSGIPLFVSEGTSDDKIQSIKASKYLTSVYETYLPKNKSDITILGWGMGKQDAHILAKLRESACEKYAVGIHTTGRKAQTIQNEINRFTETLEPFVDRNAITFFNGSSAGCWANEERN
jgi:hypothetical protein